MWLVLNKHSKKRGHIPKELSIWKRSTPKYKQHIMQNINKKCLWFISKIVEMAGLIFVSATERFLLVWMHHSFLCWSATSFSMNMRGKGSLQDFNNSFHFRGLFLPINPRSLSNEDIKLCQDTAQVVILLGLRWGRKTQQIISFGIETQTFSINSLSSLVIQSVFLVLCD